MEKELRSLELNKLTRQAFKKINKQFCSRKANMMKMAK